MGELVTQSAIGTWLERVENARGELILAAKSKSRVAAAFATAEARCELIETLQDNDIRARLLRMTDPNIAMVELANNPTDEDRVRICAIAILSGFTPGEEQFAIFGGGFDKQANKSKAGKLYTKERGFRVLFAHLGVVPEVKTEHPEWLPYGDSGRKCWAVKGSASCDFEGIEYTVEFAGNSAMRIEGYESDKVTAVAAKARRRLLQALWVKTSPILTTDHYDDDDPDTLPVITAPSSVSVIDTGKQTPQEAISESAQAAKFEHSILDKWRPLFKGAPNVVMEIGAEITKGLETEDPERLAGCEAWINQVTSEKWKTTLTGFLTAVLADVTAARS